MGAVALGPLWAFFLCGAGDGTLLLGKCSTTELCPSLALGCVSLAPTFVRYLIGFRTQVLDSGLP
jgi:hypothetical protein